MKHILETERLTLREFTLDDTPFIIQLVNSKGWLQFIGDKNVHTVEQARQYLLNGPIKSYQENGFGLSMVERKEDHSPIGMCGLIKRTFLEHPDIGFAFLPEFIGQGYAYEIAEAVLQKAKNQLNIETVLAVVMAKNTSSIKLLEKIGMKYVEPVQFPGETESLMLYSNNHSV